MPSAVPSLLPQLLLCTAPRRISRPATSTATAVWRAVPRRDSAPATPAAPPATRAAFGTTASTSYRQPALDPPIPGPRTRDPAIPPYPHGERRVYKQSNAGLYGEARIRFGNTVSDEYERKSRRTWRPNVHERRLWSAALGCFVRTRVTARVLRTIDKVGGLDEYLVGSDKPARIRELGPWGWRLRWRLLQTEAVRARFQAQREALGLPPVAAAAEEEGGVSSAGAGEGGLSAAELVEETDRMIERGDEFVLGEEQEGSSERFMQEEAKPPKN